MKTKIEKTGKKLIFKHYIVRHNGYDKNFFDNKERALEELKKNNEKDPLGINYIKIEYTYYERILIKEEPF